MFTDRQLTQEWYHCKPFEKVLSFLWDENPGTKFKRHELMERINRGVFGNNLVATNSPDEGKAQELVNEHRAKGREWLDIQDLTYHYSHFSPNRDLHSKIKMLNHISGVGDDTVYSLDGRAFVGH